MGKTEDEGGLCGWCSSGKNVSWRYYETRPTKALGATQLKSLRKGPVVANYREAAEPSDSDKVGGVFIAAEERFISYYEKLQTVAWFATKH